MIRFSDRNSTGFCNSEPEPYRTGFRKKALLDQMLISEVGPDPECRSRLRRDSSFFFQARSQKFGRNRIRNHFSISEGAGVNVVISYVKTLVNYGWSRSLNWCRIFKFEKLPESGFKNFLTGAESESERVTPVSSEISDLPIF